MLTGYSLSCTLRRSVLEIGSGVARFLMIAEYATYRYLRCVVNVMLLLSQLSVSNLIMLITMLVCNVFSVKVRHASDPS